VKQKSELLAHEVSFVRLRKRVKILASNSPVAIFAPLLGKVEERKFNVKVCPLD
jgi:hypothetical protein